MSRPAVTKLGFQCFRLVRSGHQLEPVQLIDTRASMGVFLTRMPARRTRSRVRLTTMDRIIRDTLKLSA